MKPKLLLHQLAQENLWNLRQNTDILHNSRQAISREVVFICKMQRKDLRPTDIDYTRILCKSRLDCGRRVSGGTLQVVFSEMFWGLKSIEQWCYCVENCQWSKDKANFRECSCLILRPVSLWLFLLTLVFSFYMIRYSSRYSRLYRFSQSPINVSQVIAMLRPGIQKTWQQILRNVRCLL